MYCSLLRFSCMQQRRLFKKKNPVKISSAEVILLVSFCYYMIMGLVNTTSHAAYARDLEVIRRAQMKYFICEQSGHDVNNPCDRSGLENSLVIFLIIGHFLLILYPFVQLVYILNIKWLCLKCCCCTLKESHDPVASTSSKSKTSTSKV